VGAPPAHGQAGRRAHPDEIADPSGIATDLIVEDEPDPYRLEAPGLVEEEPTRVDGDGSIVSGNIVQEVTKALFDHADDVVQKAQEAVEVETEQGREFAVGAPRRRPTSWRSRPTRCSRTATASR
jgi:hypothetical protein